MSPSNNMLTATAVLNTLKRDMGGLFTAGSIVGHHKYPLVLMVAYKWQQQPKHGSTCLPRIVMRVSERD